MYVHGYVLYVVLKQKKKQKIYEKAVSFRNGARATDSASPVVTAAEKILLLFRYDKTNRLTRVTHGVPWDGHDRTEVEYTSYVTRGLFFVPFPR